MKNVFWESRSINLEYIVKITHVKMGTTPFKLPDTIGHISTDVARLASNITFKAKHRGSLNNKHCTKDSEKNTFIQKRKQARTYKFEKFSTAAELQFFSTNFWSTLIENTFRMLPAKIATLRYHPVIIL